MKKMKKMKYIVLIFVLSLVMSCESILDCPPLDQIGMESYWKTAKDLENYILQYYPGLPEHGSTVGNQLTREDEKSDNLIIEIPNTLLNGEMTVTTGGWKKDWEDVRSINIFFANYRQCKDDLNSYKHFLGEAHFFKAWFYFKLVKKYGDVPWYNEPLYPELKEGLLKARDPRTLVVDSIIANLDKAIMYLDTRAKADGGNNRINKEAALIFKTRVALYEGTWQKYHFGTDYGTPGANPAKYFQACINAAEELMNGSYTAGVYNTGNPGSDYYTLFGLDDMSSVNEVLLYKAYNVDEKVGFNNVQRFATLYPTGMGLTWELVTSYLGKDGAPFDYMGLAQTAKGSNFLTAIAANCDPRLKSTIWIPGDLQVALTAATFTKPPINQAGGDLCTTGFQYKKYSNPASPISSMGDDETGCIIFRYGEVLLNYAEAKYELDGTVAYAQLNLLRARAGMPDFTVNPQSADLNPVDYGYTISDELYEIRRERRVETALEALRESDWKRWAAHALIKGKRFKGYPFNTSEFPGFTPPLDENGLIDYLKDALPNGYELRPGQDYLDDIPQTELVLNPNLTQNPGW